MIKLKPDRGYLSKNPILPAMVVAGIAFALISLELYKASWDSQALVRIGTRFSEGRADGTEGYDGQFSYYIAINPKPEVVEQYLDVPAYRYQRILMPMVARWMSFGEPSLIPWTLIFIGVISLAGGTYAVSKLLTIWDFNPWYGLIYGLWAGLLLSLIVDLSEPLAYGLAAFGLLAIAQKKNPPGWLLIGLSIFAKEVTLLFLAALLLEYAVNRNWKDLAGASILAGLPFVIFQGWLWIIFGRPGIGSGGAMSTSFELIPYMGILRIANHSLYYFAAMLIVFGPAIILPSIWGIVSSVKNWFLVERNWISAGLFLNSLAIAMMPFSTFRETGGVLRFATGLVLAVVLFAAKYQRRRVMNYAALWVVLNVFLLK